MEIRFTDMINGIEIEWPPKATEKPEEDMDEVIDNLETLLRSMKAYNHVRSLWYYDSENTVVAKLEGGETKVFSLAACTDSLQAVSLIMTGVLV